MLLGAAAYGLRKERPAIAHIKAALLLYITLTPIASPPCTRCAQSYGSMTLFASTISAKPSMRVVLAQGFSSHSFLTTAAKQPVQPLRGYLATTLLIVSSWTSSPFRPALSKTVAKCATAVKVVMLPVSPKSWCPESEGQHLSRSQSGLRCLVFLRMIVSQTASACSISALSDLSKSREMMPPMNSKDRWVED